MTRRLTRQAGARRRLLGLRVRLWPILQTAAAAVAAWYLASLLVSEDQPVFASIAAVISVGATYGQRPERAIELVGGVVLGIGVADLLVGATGTGPVQLGVLVVLAMAAAVLVGGGPLLVTEAAVSAILLVALEPSSAGFPPGRLIEAVVGGGVALAVSALAFPPDPGLLVGRSVQAIFGGLGRTLEELAAALSGRDTERAEAAMQAAREIDDDLRTLEDVLAVGQETARLSPGRRSARDDLARYARAARPIDFAVRDTRGLARDVRRFLRGDGTPPAGLAEAFDELGGAVWTLAAELDAPTHGAAEVRRQAARAATRAAQSFDGGTDLDLAAIVAHARSTAVDLVRVAEAGAVGGDEEPRLSTEELLVELPALAAER